MADAMLRAEYEEMRRSREERTLDHNALIELKTLMPEVRSDVAEIKTLLQSQNGRIRKLEERWWIAMGALLAD